VLAATTSSLAIVGIANEEAISAACARRPGAALPPDTRAVFAVVRALIDGLRARLIHG
jgi:hypothetical protein